MALEDLVRPVYDASHDVIDAVRKLILRTEESEEQILRRRLPEVQLSDEELRDLDTALNEMEKEGASVSLEEVKSIRLCC